MRVWFVGLFERLLNAQPYRDGKPYTSLSITRLLKRMIILLVVLISSCGADVSPSTTVPSEEANLDFFPLGLYDVKPWDDFDGIKAAGFNMIHVYDTVQTLDSATAYLEAAEAAGLKVRQNMPRDLLYAGDEFWIEWVTTLSAYDSLAWWYMPEEPIGTGLDHTTMVRLYEIVQQYDPQHRPVALYFGNTGAQSPRLGDWCDATDILMLGCYPEYAQWPRVCMKRKLEAGKSACPSKFIVGVPQFFDSSSWGGAPGHPSPHEARLDAYLALIAGAKGLTWFSYWRGMEAELAELWEGLQEIASELHELGPVILSPDVPQTVTASVISGPIQSPTLYGRVYDSIQLLQKEDGGTYLFACNVATDTVVTEFSGLSPDVIAVEVLYEGRMIPVSAGSFRDSFAEADVHIYRTVDGIIHLPLVMQEIP